MQPARNVSDAEETAGEAAYRRIRADVVLGRLAPGRKLGLEGLRDNYGVAVGTLREALNRLAAEALVQAEGQRGFVVAPVSAEDFHEVAELRLLLETEAIAASFAVGDLDWEGQVVAAHHKLAVMERRLLAGETADASLWKHYDREFHHALIAACGSSVLLETFAATYDRFLRYQMVAVVFRGAVAAAQHAGLLDCALARDAAGAGAILRDHVEGCVEHVVRVGALMPFLASAPRAASVEPPLVDAEATSERARRRIRADILRGTLAPGQKLRLEGLRDTYGAAVGTLRESLSRLIAERLVVAEGQRGFEVSRFSAQELRELARLRLLLEGHALEHAFRVGDMEWEGRVAAAHHKLAQAEKRLGAGEADAIDAWRRFDSEFHRALVSACGSRTLMATHATVFDRYLRYQNLALGFRGTIAVEEHAALRDCAIRRDAAGARDILAAHILGGVDHALASGAV
jgi:DNA-binding GntR family transcriptional regulator